MLWRLFYTTFVLIFVAELGDKTQLAVMARAASASTRWTVFLAASVALVASTLVAVLFGEQLARRVDPRWIKIVSGVLFIGFGVLILRDGWRSIPETAESATAPGPISRMVLAQAAAFEQAAFRDYSALAEKAANPDLRRMFESMAADEGEHIRCIEQVRRKHAHAHVVDDEAAGVLPAADAILKDVSVNDADRLLLEHAIKHEETTAGFYEELSRLTLVPSLRKTFAVLAETERAHAREMRARLLSDG